jgi:putative membrane protein
MHDGGTWWPMGGMMLGWSLLTVVLVGVVVWLVVAYVRPRAADSTDSARRILADRYARGEVDTDEYERRLGGLR